MTLLDTVRAWVSTPGPTVAVDIAADGVSAVAVNGADAAVAGHAQAPLPAGVVTPAATSANVRDRAAAAAAVRDVLGRLPRRDPRVSLVVPDSAAKVSILHFESAPARRGDLEKLIRWKVRDAVPFGLDDAQVAWDATAPHAAGRDFVAVVMRRDIVEEYEAVALAAGVQPGVVAPASFGLLSLVPGGSGDRLLVHAAAGYNAAAIVRDGNLVLYRSQPGAQDADLTYLVHRTAMYYEDRLGGAGFTQVLLAADHRAARAVIDRLAARIDAPVTSLHAVGGPDVPAAAAGALLGPSRLAA